MSTKRISQIDGLRAVALIIILLFHFIFWRAYLPESTRMLYPYLREWGLIGVGIFFIISGYFLFPSEQSGAFSIRSYFLSKLRTLWLPYALAVCIIWCIFRTGVHPDYTPSIKNLIANLTGAQFCFEITAIDGAHWYMGQLAAFIIMAAIIRRMKWNLLYAIPIYYFVCMLVHFSIPAPHKILLIACGAYKNAWNFLPIMMGICARQYTQSRIYTYKYIYLVYIIVLCGSLYFFYIPPDWYTPCAATCLILFYIIFILCTKSAIKLLEWKPLVYLGSISFFVYLIHQRLGALIILKLFPDFGMPVAVLAAIAISLILGFLLQKVYQTTTNIIRLLLSFRNK